MCREISSTQYNHQRNLFLNQTSSRSIAELHEEAMATRKSIKKRTVSPKKAAKTTSKKFNPKKMKAEEILRELDKPDKSRMVRILKSFLLSPEELGEPSVQEKNKT